MIKCNCKNLKGIEHYIFGNALFFLVELNQNHEASSQFAQFSTKTGRREEQ